MSKKIVLLIPRDDRVHYIHYNCLFFICIYDCTEETYTYYKYDSYVDFQNQQNLFTQGDIIFTSDKKTFDRLFPNTRCYDINTQHWLIYNEAFFNWHNFSLYNSYKKFYTNYVEWCTYVLEYKWEEICQQAIAHILKKPEILNINEISEYYTDKVYPNITFIESAGIRINNSVFNDFFDKNYDTDYVYCNYHLHTTTGRPSNTFDNVNFSALNKKDGTRKSFISRFEKGILIEYDLDAYHLRLIAQILNYSLPNESVHVYFGKQFFKKEHLTDEEYIQSKNISFKLAYGGLTAEYSHVDFFHQMEDFKAKLWHSFNYHGYITSPLSKRKIKKSNLEDMNASKLLNYLLQMHETEYSIIFIQEIKSILENKKSKLILYTYDSFLLITVLRMVGNC